MQSSLEMIEVFVDIFAMQHSKGFIDTNLLHGGIFLEVIKNMIPKWDLDYKLEEIQYVDLAHCLDVWRIYLLDRKFIARTYVLHNHIYNTSRRVFGGFQYKGDLDIVK